MPLHKLQNITATNTVLQSTKLHQTSYVMEIYMKRLTFYVILYSLISYYDQYSIKNSTVRVIVYHPVNRINTCHNSWNIHLRSNVNVTLKLFHLRHTGMQNINFHIQKYLLYFWKYTENMEVFFFTFECNPFVDLQWSMLLVEIVTNNILQLQKHRK